MSAKSRLEQVFRAAGRAAVGDLSARHRDKKPRCPLDYLDVSHDKTAVEGDAGEAQKLLIAVRQFYFHIGNLHRGTLP